MPKKGASKKRIIPDLLSMKYEHLFRIIGREGKFSLELKCLFLVLVLCIPCLILNFLSGTLLIYLVESWGHLIATAFVGVFMWFLIRFLLDMEDKFLHVNQIIFPSQKRINKFRKWALRLESNKWYFIDATIGAICGFIIGLAVIQPDIGWVAGTGSLYKEWYLRAWFIFQGFFIGACLSFLWKGFGAIRKYCKDVVSHENVVPLDPDRTGGLRELGKLSLDLDLIVALPSVGFPIYLLRYKLLELFESSTLNISTSEIYATIALSAFYALFLVLVFFIAISPAHDKMAKAKITYLLKVHGEYRDMHKLLLHRLDTEQRMQSEEYNRLSSLYELYDRVEKMAVWPLDFRTVTRFLVTSLLPLISVGISIRI